MSGPAIGAVADDFTGATDLAGMFARAGMATAQAIGTAGLDALDLAELDAVVVALKTRSIAVEAAVRHSVDAAKMLRSEGVEQLYFKYCSTFDSTREGNIGPVAAALADLTGATHVPFCPAFPENGRSVHRGYLFVGDVLLNESGMEHHPLTPMTDANLVRWLQHQTSERVGLLRADVLRQGVAAARRAVEASECRFLVTDAVTFEDILVTAEAFRDAPLVTGGSALGLALGQLWQREQGRRTSTPAGIRPRPGRSAILAGSCSTRTLAQIEAFGGPRYRLEATTAVENGEAAVAAALAWAAARGDGPFLIHASAPPEAVKTAQARFGTERVGHAIEAAMAALGKALVAAGVTRLIVAGGETSGAVTQALAVPALRIGPEIAPGVPWTQVTGGPAEGLCLALKSGNFGAADMFGTAFSLLEE
ncbi:MAG: 3-oxo-tetronate kinase [Pseudomonadota bacterium]